jgi:acyl-CoA thioester hydrolase
MYIFDTHIRVRYAETDQMAVVYHGNYFAFFEQARGEAIRNIGYTYADVEKLGVIMPVAHVDCKYIRPLRYDELINVRTILKEIPQQHDMKFIHEIYNQTGSLAAVANIKLVFVDAKTGKKTFMPAVFKDTLHKFIHAE